MAITLTSQSIDSSCFDPHIIGPPITLRLKFNFLGTTTTPPIHAITRSRFNAFLPSSLVMKNERSYDMCTENLGNETGCEMTETTLLPYTNDHDSAPGEIVEVTKKYVSRSFPPPLTTMSGAAELILVSPRREGGRLIIKATRSPSSMFQMERSDGRLRMCVLASCDENTYEEAEAVADEQEVDNVNESGTREEVTMKKVGVGGGGCKQDEPQNAPGLFNWEPLNWVATT